MDNTGSDTNLKTLGLTEITRNLIQFKQDVLPQIEEAKKENITGSSERRGAQTFWNMLLECFGYSPAIFRTFEVQVKKHDTGRDGYIDLHIPGNVVGEAKSIGKKLDKAHGEQAWGYVQDLEPNQRPRHIITTNFENFNVEDIESGNIDHFPLSEIDDYAETLLFLTGHTDLTRHKQEVASKEAVKLITDIYTSIVGEDSDLPVGDEATVNPEEESQVEHDTSILLTRLLFLLYGDDANLWGNGLFDRWLKQPDITAQNLGPQLERLFKVLDTPQEKRTGWMLTSPLMNDFPYVNGGIFSQADTVDIDLSTIKDELLNASSFDWSKIDPSIFGSLFQMVKSKEARRSDGEHYTTRENILKVLNPMFLEEFDRQADELIAAPDQGRGKQKKSTVS